MDESHKQNVRQKEPDARSVQFYIWIIQITHTHTHTHISQYTCVCHLYYSNIHTCTYKIHVSIYLYLNITYISVRHMWVYIIQPIEGLDNVTLGGGVQQEATTGTEVLVILFLDQGGGSMECRLDKKSLNCTFLNCVLLNLLWLKKFT